MAQEKSSGIETVIVEAGHIYSDEIPAKEHIFGAKIGALICGFLEGIGYKTEKWLFIDDYNPQCDDKLMRLDEEDYKRMLAAWGFAPSKTIHESELVKKAGEMLEYLKKEGFAGQESETGKMVLHKGNIILYNPSDNRYTCALLDACLYMMKHESGEYALTVLDEQYKAQQRATRTILNKMGMGTETIVPVYYKLEEVAAHASVDPSNIYVKPEQQKITLQETMTMMKLMGKVADTTRLIASIEVGNLKLTNCLV